MQIYGPRFNILQVNLISLNQIEIKKEKKKIRQDLIKDRIIHPPITRLLN